MAKLPRRDGDDQSFVEALCGWLESEGQSWYDESVTQLQHALQSADLAQRDGEEEPLIIASLLHDVGHLIVDEHAGHADFLEEDLHHEGIGARWLARYFGPAVTEPIRLHVAAKRYLCTVDRAYHDRLSQSSKRSLEVQGGLMTPAEVAAFDAQAHSAAALRLRLIDDRAKASDAAAPDLHHWRPLMSRQLTPMRAS